MDVQPVTHPLRASLLAAASLLLAGAGLGGCATRAADVRPVPANPAEFMAWECSRIAQERDRVQQRAADLAYTVDERAGNNILALGLGVTVFWPVLLALRPDGPESEELGRLKGRYEALTRVAQVRSCDAYPDGAAQTAALPVSPGERLVYEDRADPRRAPSPWVLTVGALRRGEIDYRLQSPRTDAPWRQDLAGNVLQAPDGALAWRRLLRGDLDLGQLVEGEMSITGDPLARARLRGQVVAVGPHTVDSHRFDAAVIELFGDAAGEGGAMRVDGAIVVDRRSGVLLRLDLRSAHPAFRLQRRLMRVEPAPAAGGG